MKLFVFALFAVALQVAAAQETGTYTCTTTGSTLVITGADASKKRMFVEGQIANDDCKKPMSSGGGTIPFIYATCGLSKPTPGTAGDVNVIIYSTVLDDGTHSGTIDAKHTYTCSYDTAGNPTGTVTGSSNIKSTVVFTPVTANRKVPTLEVKIVDSTTPATEYSATNKATVGTKVLVRTTFTDAPPRMFVGLAKVKSVKYTSGANNLDVILDSCTTGLDTSPPKIPQKIGERPADIVTIDSTAVNVVAFPGSDTLTVTVVLEICVADNDRCKTGTCPLAGRRRRDVGQGDVILAYANVTVSVRNENSKKNTDSQPVCAGYTSNTVFYVVVVVLTVLLVFTIGVAAYFGAQAKKRVVLAGKDNPVYT